MKRSSPDAIFRSHKMRFGAEVREGSTRFKLWAPKCKTLQLKLKGRRSLIDMDAMDDGWFRVDVEGVGAGALYKYV
ncbi:MAG: malto-oligosyltrehalose trehalohydrolase, partial [Burkholderiales bacterium]